MQTNNFNNFSAILSVGLGCLSMVYLVPKQARMDDLPDV